MVLLKRVPDLVEDLEVDDTKKALDTEYLTLKLNEFDDHALEEALCLKEASGGEVTAIALDGEDVDKILFTALAKGADRAIKIRITPPRSPQGDGGVAEGGSNLALAKVYASIVADESPDLILTGVQSAEDRDGQLGPMVAALRGIPGIEVVTGVEIGDGIATLHKEYSGGITAELEVDLPAVLGIQAARQTPRYAPVSKVRAIQQGTTLETVERKAEDGATAIVVMTPPETGEGAQMLGGVDELVELLDSKGVI